MADFDGVIVEYRDDGELHLGCVMEKVGARLQIVDEADKRTKIPASRVLWQHRERATSLSHWPEVRTRLLALISSAQAELDVELLWEALDEDAADVEHPPATLASLFFTDAGPVELSALWRALTEEGVYFRRKGMNWVRRTAAQVATLREQRQRAASRAHDREITREWVRQSLRHPQPGQAPGEARPLLDRVEHWLYRRTDDTGIPRLLQEAAPFLEPPEAAYRLLLCGGRLSPEDDRYLALAGLNTVEPASVTGAAASLAPYEPETEPVPADFSIDDPETREVDDALSVERCGDDWRVSVDIADVARFVRPGDPLDVEAARRATTAYLPTLTVCMLPERLSCDLASLREGAIRPAVRFQVVVSPEGEVRSVTVERVAVAVTCRLHYDDVDRALAAAGAGETDAPSLTEEVLGKLSVLSALAGELRNRRRKWGAVTFERPEWKVRIVDGEVHVKRIPRDSPARLLVAEMMILTNSVAAAIARDHDLPLIFRIQDPPTEPLPPMLEYDPVAFDRLRRALRPARLSLHPGNHHGLGVSPYTQVTSPLRRYTDLVMQRQLGAHLAGQPLPYTRDQLFTVLVRAEEVARQVSRAEAAAVRHYLLVYFERHCTDRPLEAVVLGPVRGGYRVELVDWGIEAVLRTSQPLSPGARVSAKIQSIDPPGGTLRLGV